MSVPDCSLNLLTIILCSESAQNAKVEFYPQRHTAEKSWENQKLEGKKQIKEEDSV